MRYNHGDVRLVMCCALQSHETVVQWLVYTVLLLTCQKTTFLSVNRTGKGIKIKANTRNFQRPDR